MAHVGAWEETLHVVHREAAYESVNKVIEQEDRLLAIVLGADFGANGRHLLLGGLFSLVWYLVVRAVRISMRPEIHYDSVECGGDGDLIPGAGREGLRAFCCKNTSVDGSLKPIVVGLGNAERYLVSERRECLLDLLSSRCDKLVEFAVVELGIVDNLAGDVPDLERVSAHQGGERVDSLRGSRRC